VLLGKNVSIAAKAIVAGPAVIGDNVVIGVGAVVRSAVIDPGVSVAQGSVVQNHVLTTAGYDVPKESGDAANTHVRFDDFDAGGDHENFRTWSKLSYVRFGKRIFDIIAATVVLILFAPFFPLIAIAVKLNSPGPVFYKDRRQGMYGNDIDCLKFRSMVISADKMQDNLRATNQVDGPQFKMTHDPRITAVGRFLRETYIDEIPQFINVLLGQMSTVGPRPSPEKENRFCPAWRDARLSVRPGITGLWQVDRTRLPGRDFQEWILYDTKYVRDLSWRLDMKICWKTAKKLVKTFFDQF
jgi:lipopolysaccharide/colanic/teichoic acid biosynthesis glycosyltransferase